MHKRGRARREVGRRDLGRGESAGKGGSSEVNGREWGESSGEVEKREMEVSKEERVRVSERDGRRGERRDREEKNK